jgi:hypothetical protein
MSSSPRRTPLENSRVAGWCGNRRFRWPGDRDDRRCVGRLDEFDDEGSVPFIGPMAIAFLCSRQGPIGRVDVLPPY